MVRFLLTFSLDRSNTIIYYVISSALTTSYMDNTLLESFIERKAKAYAEPSRRGMSKGQRMGFSKKKYLATLYMLTADKQITMAMELGISYGLLRKWNTEGPFKAMVRQHCREFADTFVKYVVERYEQQENARNEYLNSSRAAVPSSSPFRDSRDYSPELLAEIFNAVVAYAQRTELERSPTEALGVVLAFLAMMVPVVGEKTSKEIMKNAGIDFTVVARQLKLQALGRVKEIILKHNITDDERKEAYYLLTELGTII